MTAVEPTETRVLDGEVSHSWGPVVVLPNEDRDPVPTVYATGGEVEFGDYCLSLDAGEVFARRVLNAVAFQRAQNVGGHVPSADSGVEALQRLPRVVPGPLSTPQQGGPGADFQGGAS